MKPTTGGRRCERTLASIAAPVSAAGGRTAERTYSMAQGLITGEGEAHWESEFCSATDAPIELGAAKVIEVRVVMGTCSDNQPSIVTSGTITATFSR